MAQLHPAALVLVADLQAAGLCIPQIGAGAHLEVLLLPGRPGLDVAGLALQIRQIAGAALQLPHGDIQRAEQLHAVTPQLLVPRLGVLRLADHDHLLLLELVDAVDAPLLDAVGTLLLAEAGGVGGQGLGQALHRDDLLTGTDEVQVLALDLIHHGVHVRLAHDALHHAAVDHEGGDAVGEALVDHKVPAIGQHGLVEPGDVAHEIVKAVAGHPAGSVQIDAVESLHDVRVVGDIEGWHRGLAEALHLHVAAVVLADWHGGVDHLRDHQQDVVDLLAQLLLHLLQLSQTVGVGLHLRLHRLGLLQLGGILLGLTH